MTSSLKVFSHPGTLCKALRQVREPLGQLHGQTSFAKACGVSERMLKYFENGERLLSDEAFNLYLKSLYLTESDKKRLQSMYRSYQNKTKLENRLGYYGVDEITRNKYLLPYLRKIESSPEPAYIADELMFIHAMNRAFAQMFYLDTSLLEDAHSWHSMIAEFYPSSPIRKFSESSFYFVSSFSVRMFQETLETNFFAKQSLALQQALLDLSPAVYGKHWLATMMMTLPDYPKDVIRDIYYNGSSSQWQIRKSSPILVPLTNGPLLAYHVITWDPVDAEAKNMREMFTRTGKPSVIFAQDYAIDHAKAVAI